MFLFKNINASTCFGFKQLLNLVTVSPAVEKTLSEGVDVPGMQNSRLATYDTTLKQGAFSFHHFSGFSRLGKGGSVRYLSNSALRVGSDIMVLSSALSFLGRLATDLVVLCKPSSNSLYISINSVTDCFSCNCSVSVYLDKVRLLKRESRIAVSNIGCALCNSFRLNLSTIFEDTVSLNCLIAVD